MNGRTEAEDMEREYQRQSLRDTFAAAALTGMLGSGDLVIDPSDGTATTLTVLDAYRWADAMLRERSRAGQKLAESDSFCAVCPEREHKTSAETNNDRGSVTPESYPKNDEKRGDPTTKRCATQPRNGALGEPVAWVAWFDDEDRPDADFLFSTKERADDWCCKRGADPVPLYRHRQPTLTDAEREAVAWASETLCVGWHDLAAEDKQRTRDAAATLQDLVERMK